MLIRWECCICGTLYTMEKLKIIIRHNKKKIDFYCCEKPIHCGRIAPITNDTIKSCDNCNKEIIASDFAKVVRDDKDDAVLLCKECWGLFRNTPDYKTFQVCSNIQIH